MAYAAAAVFGFGIGGLLTVPPIAWADTFGRRSFGAIRDVVLSVQVTGQAMGSALSGILRDTSGRRALSLQVFIGLTLAPVVAIRFLVRSKAEPQTSPS